MKNDSFYSIVISSFVIEISFFHVYDFEIPKILGFVPKILRRIQYGDIFSIWSV